MLNKIKKLFSSKEILNGNFGIERETLRVDENGYFCLLYTSTGEVIVVRCYTNVKNPQLFLNGILQSQFIDTSDKGYLTWNVVFEEGKLEAIAGEVRHKLETVGAATTIRLKPVSYTHL